MSRELDPCDEQRLAALNALAKHLGILQPEAEPTLAPANLTQVKVTEVYLDRLTTAQLDELDRLLEAAGLPAPNGSAQPPMLEAAPVPSHEDRP